MMADLACRGVPGAARRRRSWRIRSLPAGVALAACAALGFGAGDTPGRDDLPRLFRGQITSAGGDGTVGVSYDFSHLDQYGDFEGAPRGTAGRIRLALFQKPVWLKAYFTESVSLDMDVTTNGAPCAIYVLVDPDLDEGYVFLFGFDIAPTRSVTAVARHRQGKPPEIVYVGQRGAWTAGSYAISLSRAGDELEMSIDKRIVVKTKDNRYRTGRIGFSGDFTIARLEVRGRLDRRWCEGALSAAPDVMSTSDFFGRVGARQGFALSREIPDWKEPFERATPHYSVTSNVSQAFADKHARFAESLPALFGEIVPPPAPDGPKFKIVIFATRDEFMRFGAPATSLGFYLPATRTVYLFDHRNPAVTRRVLLHEAVRQCLHGAVADPPPWLSEGLAQYFEMAATNGETFKLGAASPRVRHLAQAMKRGLPTEVPKLMVMPRGAFENPFAVAVNHSCSWGLVHFFLHYRDGVYRKHLVEYIELLRRGAGNAEAVEKAFGQLDWDRVKPEWFNYIIAIEESRS